MHVTRSTPLHEQAYEAIWQAIRTGEVAAGERLRDTDWAARLGISRTPVREALRKLEHDGVLAGLDAGGYLLRPLEPQEVIDLYECRAVLEGLCARRAAGAVLPAEVSALEAVLDDTSQALDADDLTRVYELNSEFHRQLLAVGGTRPLRRMVGQLTRQVEFARVTVLRSVVADPAARGRYVKSLRQDLDDHRAVLLMVAAGDGSRAEQRARKHIQRTAKEQVSLAP